MMLRRVRTAVVAFAAAIALGGGATSPASAGAVLGPDGYKGLELGQSEQQAVETGLLVNRQQPQECVFYHLRPEEGVPNPGGGVFIDPQLGVVMIGGTDQIRTPEGIAFGAALDEVRTAYPDLTQDPETDFVYTAAVPGHPDLQYRFAVDENDHVSDFGLNAPDMGSCAS